VLSAAPLALSGEDRAELERLARSGDRRLAERARIIVACADSSGGIPGWRPSAKTSQVLALGAKIVLACAGGRENKAVAAQLRTTEHPHLIDGPMLRAALTG
jgi:hypothetical protein